MKPLVIATRRSALALWQAEHIAERLRAVSGREVELLPLVTTGDKILDVPLARVGGKGLFVKEIEEALLDGRADLAVHSLKDVPTQLPPGLRLGAMTEREDPRDAICSKRYPSFDALPEGARLGTSSLRRQAQLKALRPDLRIVNVRGNVQTRLSKLEKEADAVVLAHAGLLRLGLGEEVAEVLEPERSLPAIGQGILGIEIREGDHELEAIMRKLDHPPSNAAGTAERALLAALEGGCQVPIAGYAKVEGGELTLRALVARPDGSTILRDERSGPLDRAVELGVEAADALLVQGAGAILREVIAAGAPQVARKGDPGDGG